MDVTVTRTLLIFLCGEATMESRNPKPRHAVSFLKMSGDGGLLFSFPEPKHGLNIFYY
jgi:hypothetical protein